MDIQVRYTGSVEQFQNLQKKKKEKSHLIYFIFFICHRKYGERKNVSIYRDRTKIQKSEGNTNLGTDNVKA